LAQRESPPDLLERAPEIGPLPGLALLEQSPSKVVDEVVLQSGRVGTLVPAFLDPGPQPGHEGIEVERGTVLGRVVAGHHRGC
jgi:hypothetical protein